MTKSKSKVYISILVTIVLVSTIIFFFNLNKEEIQNEELQVENTTNIILGEAYPNNIHFQLGVGEKDKLIITLNNQEVFNSEIDRKEDFFQIQINNAINGENTLKIIYEEQEDNQPLVLYIIKDRKNTILNWEPKNLQGEEEINFNLN